MRIVRSHRVIFRRISTSSSAGSPTHACARRAGRRAPRPRLVAPPRCAAAAPRRARGGAIVEPQEELGPAKLELRHQSVVVAAQQVDAREDGAGATLGDAQRALREGGAAGTGSTRRTSCASGVSRAAAGAPPQSASSAASPSARAPQPDRSVHSVEELPVDEDGRLAVQRDAAQEGLKQRAALGEQPFELLHSPSSPAAASRSTPSPREPSAGLAT